MEHAKTVADLSREQSLDIVQIAERAGLDESRVRAIVEGRWTPSPSERDRIAAVFGLTRDRVCWSHSTPISHIHGHGPQFGRSP